MKLQRFEHDHREIMDGIQQLRKLIATGIEHNANEITLLLRKMSASIKLHLAVEDRVVYPALANSGRPELAAMGRFYQEEMGDLSRTYAAFANRCNLANRVAADPEGFRAEANTVFKALFLRTRREERELYPAFSRLYLGPRCRAHGRSMIRPAPYWRASGLGAGSATLTSRLRSMWWKGSSSLPRRSITVSSS
jgi:hypothetical protein